MESKIWFRVPKPEGEPIEPTLEQVILNTLSELFPFPGDDDDDPESPAPPI
jgi:hypothetical protein